MVAAIVALMSTVKVPGINPNRYPLEAVKGKAGIAKISATSNIVEYYIKMKRMLKVIVPT